MRKLFPEIFCLIKIFVVYHISSVIRQKGESQNGCFKKTKHAKFSEKRLFLTPWYPHVCVSGGKKCSFFGKFGLLCFLETPILRFTLFAYYRRFIKTCCLWPDKTFLESAVSHKNYVKRITSEAYLEPYQTSEMELFCKNR